MKNKISYQESCFIVNAMNYYIGAFKSKNLLNKDELKYYDNIINKYCKLEPQILKLEIKEA